MDTIHKIWLQQLAVATYSALAVDCATEDCFLEDQETREVPKKWQVPKLLFLSNRQPAKSELQNPRMDNEEEQEYQMLY